MTDFLVAALQITSTSNVEANFAEAEEQIELASRRGAELIGLPENFAFLGEDNEKLRMASELSTKCTNFLKTMSQRYQVFLLGGGYPVPAGDDRHTFNRSALFGKDGSILAKYDKIHLFDADVSDTNRRYRESDDFSRGNRPVVFDSPWGRIGLAICYDLRFPELFLHFAHNRVSIILIPSAFTEATGRDHWEILLRARAIECQCFIVAPNQGGCHNEKLNTWGRSMVVDPWGNILSSLDKGEGVVVADLDLSMIQKICDRMPIASHRRFNVS